MVSAAESGRFSQDRYVATVCLHLVVVHDFMLHCLAVEGRGGARYSLAVYDTSMDAIR